MALICLALSGDGIVPAVQMNFGKMLKRKCMAIFSKLRAAGSISFHALRANTFDRYVPPLPGLQPEIRPVKPAGVSASPANSPQLSTQSIAPHHSLTRRRTDGVAATARTGSCRSLWRCSKICVNFGMIICNRWYFKIYYIRYPGIRFVVPGTTKKEGPWNGCTRG